MSWEHFGLEYMPVQKKGVEVLVTGLSGADDTTYYGWGTTITSWNKRFFYSEEFLKNAQRFLPWVEQDVHNLGNWAYRNFGIVMVEGEFNGYTQASFFGENHPQREDLRTWVQRRHLRVLWLEVSRTYLPGPWAGKAARRDVHPRRRLN